MKNATRYCAGPAYYRCSTDVYCSKQTGSSSTKGNHHPSFLRLALQKKMSDAAKICGGVKMLLKQKPSKHQMIARFYYFRHLYPAGSACIVYNNCMSCSTDMATRPALLIMSTLPFQLLWHSDQPLSMGEIIPFSGVRQSGEAALSTPEAVVASRTD